MRKRFKDAVADAGIRSIRFHDLRHTFGTRMAGAPLRFIQEWMGHRDYKTTEIYADFAPDPSQEAGWAEAAFGGRATRKAMPRTIAIRARRPRLTDEEQILRQSWRTTPQPVPFGPDGR